MNEVGIALYDTRLIDSAEMKPKVELEIGPDPNRIKISGQVLHCVFDYSTDAPSEPTTTCNQCDHRPSTVISNGHKFSPQIVSLEVCVSNLSCSSSTQLSSDPSGSSATSDSSVLFDCSVPLDEYKSVPMLDHFSVPDVFCIDPIDSNCNYDINPELSVDHRNNILNIIQNDYIDLRNVPIQEHTYEMKLNLTSEIPINFPPRRLSYSDKIEVDRIVEGLLSAGIVRPSSSPTHFQLF